MLQNEGADVRAYDPQAMAQAERELPTVAYCCDAYETAKGCDAVVLTTEWDQFRYLDWARVRAAMRGDIFIDGRNLYDPETMIQAGFRYRPIGRGIVPF